MEEIRIKTEHSDWYQEYAREVLPDTIVHIPKFGRGNPMSYRYIQFSTAHPDHSHIHYELCNKANQWWMELHFEGCSSHPEYAIIIREIRRKTRENDNLVWFPIGPSGNRGCRLLKPVIDEDDIFNKLQEIADIFDKELGSYGNLRAPKEKIAPDTSILTFKPFTTQAKGNVVLEDLSLFDILQLNISIPDYQRIYCWEDKQVRDLWKDINYVESNKTLHLGSLILHETHDKQTDSSTTINKYDIIDGQQRLVTLTLILREMGYQGQLPLLRHRFESEDACKHVANTKALIDFLINGNIDPTMAEKIVSCLRFSVLVLKGSNLDLAYTFFSNQNSKGVPLSDFDLLKAHHLRYLHIESQAKHLAQRWNSLSSEYSPTGENYLETALGKHIFRLRKWMRNYHMPANTIHQIKEEFSSALQMESIPPFGERFHFYEKIQGGSHFFAYADQFVFHFKTFIKTEQCSLLREHLQYGSHAIYADVIETLLFGYFLKFGNQYLSEALFCISGIIAQHRYTASRAIRRKVLQFAHDSEIIRMIDQASSPTFFLAESIQHIHQSGQYQEDDVKYRFYRSLCNIFSSLNDFTDSTITTLKNDEYC